MKKRNLLRKLDVGLNSVHLSKEELAEASSDVLQSQETESRSHLYMIDIPPVEEDFPHLSGDKTNIYPLPISHENQCKIVGVASNLDLFASEFGFKTNKAKKYLPLKMERSLTWIVVTKGMFLSNHWSSISYNNRSMNEF